jgi:hypothetical protein
MQLRHLWYVMVRYATRFHTKSFVNYPFAWWRQGRWQMAEERKDFRQKGGYRGGFGITPYWRDTAKLVHKFCRLGRSYETQHLCICWVTKRALPFPTSIPSF